MGKERGGEEHPSICAKQKVSTNAMICRGQALIKEGFERSEPVSDGIASADRERCGMNMPRRTSVTRSVPDIEAKRRARRRRETKKREWHVSQTPFFLDRFRPLPEAVAEKEGFALQRAPLGNDEAWACRGARACTSHAARGGEEERQNEERGGEEHPSFCSKQSTSTTAMIC